MTAETRMTLSEAKKARAASPIAQEAYAAARLRFELGEAVRLRRAELEISQSELGRRADMTSPPWPARGRRHRAHAAAARPDRRGARPGTAGRVRGAREERLSRAAERSALRGSGPPGRRRPGRRRSRRAAPGRRRGARRVRPAWRAPAGSTPPRCCRSRRRRGRRPRPGSAELAAMASMMRRLAWCGTKPPSSPG